MADNDDFFNTFKSFSSNLPSNSGKKFIFKKTSNNVSNSTSSALNFSNKTTGSISKIVTSNTTLKDNSKIQNAGKEISSIHKSELIDKGATKKETDFTSNNVEIKKTLNSSPSLKNLKKDLKSRSFLKNVMKRSTTLDSLDAFDLNSSKVSLKKNQTCVKSNKSNTTLNGFLSLKKNFMDGQSEYSPLVTKDNVGIQSKSSQESLNSNTSNESISSTKKFVFKKRDSANAGSSSIVSSDSSIKNIETNMTAFDKIGDDNQAHMGSPHFDKKETGSIFVENTNVEKLNKQNVSSPKFTFRKKTDKSLEASKLPNLSMAKEHSCTIYENKVSSSKFSFTKM
ncbi:hypothetical protein WA026_013514 [Henosepilachna vigintioctopunctata]|uniref:Uncharacterized protein n=1 Tax=Henosepilachna vigintioctopunctata TaxID=420089 RepID=A0AAW1VDL5_9CUCU